MNIGIRGSLLVGVGPGIMPDRLVSAGEKGEEYCVRMSRALVGNVDVSVINQFRQDYWKNGVMTFGEQWINEEDINAFLNNEGRSTGRTDVMFNVMRQVLEKFRGTAAKMKFNVTAKPITPRVKTRRDIAWGKALLMHGVAKASPALRGGVSKIHPVGDTEAETYEMFDSTWQDALSVGMNQFLPVVASICEFDRWNEQQIQDLVLSGACVEHLTTHGQHMKREHIEPGRWVWDTNAKEPDLSDSSHMTVEKPLDPMTIFERFNPSKEDKEIIEASARNAFGTGATFFNNQSFLQTNNNAWKGIGVTVLSTYWRDGSYCQYGFVNDEMGEPQRVMVNYIEPDAPKGTKPKYTDDDLLPLEDIPEWARGEFVNSNKITCWNEVMRYCQWIPWEYLCAGKQNQWRGSKNIGDIVLAHGYYPLQEYDSLDTSSIRFPIKAVTHAMFEGRIIALMTDLRSPQILLNQSLSVMKARMAMSGGNAVWFDESMLVGTTKPEDAPHVQKTGGVGFLDSGGRGISNAIQQTDTGVNNTTMAGFQTVDNLRNMVQRMGNAGDAVIGQAQGELVGSQELNINAANTLDFPVYKALADLHYQLYQHGATAGVQWYLDHRDVLFDLVDSETVRVMMMSEDIPYERWRVTIVPSESPEVEAEKMNALMMNLLVAGLLDRARVADLWWRGTKESVAKAMRDYAMDTIGAQAAMAKKEEAQMQLQGLAAQDMQLQAEQAQDDKFQQDITLQAMDNDSKEELAVLREASKNLAPQKGATTATVPA